VIDLPMTMRQLHRCEINAGSTLECDAGNQAAAFRIAQRQLTVALQRRFTRNRQAETDTAGGAIA
jgi:hypothetical protein